MKRMKKMFLAMTVVMLFVLLHTSSVFAATSVAKINGKGYSTLQNAVNAVKKGQTIVVTKDISTRTTVKINRPKVSFSIDFAGKKYAYSGSAAAFQLEAGTVTFKRGKVASKSYSFYVKPETKAVINSGTYKGYILNNGTLKINKGTFNTLGTVASNYDETIRNYGTLTIMGGTFTGTKDSAIYNTKKLIIQGGTFKSTVQQQNGAYFPTIFNASKTSTAIIYKGTVTGSGSCLENYGIMTINGGSYRSLKRVTVVNRNKMSINDGTFAAVKGIAAITNHNNMIIKDATVTATVLNNSSGTDSLRIYGGNYKTQDDITLNNYNGTTYVSGGVFEAVGDVTTLVNNAAILKVGGGTFKNSSYYYTLENKGKSYLSGGTFVDGNGNNAILSHTSGYIGVGTNVRYTGKIVYKD